MVFPHPAIILNQLLYVELYYVYILTNSVQLEEGVRTYFLLLKLIASNEL
jgi:hypothetical protein